MGENHQHVFLNKQGATVKFLEYLQNLGLASLFSFLPSLCLYLHLLSLLTSNKLFDMHVFI